MNVKHYLENKPGYAFAHLQEQFWLNIIDESLKITCGHVSNAAELLGISKQTLSSWSKTLGINPNDYKRNGISIEMQCKIIEAVEDNKSKAEIADICGISRVTVSKYLDILGLKTKYFKNFTKEELEKATCMFMYRYQAADYFGVSPQTLEAHMKRLNVNDPWSKK